MKEIKIGILGLGTVGSAVAANLKKNAAAIVERTGVRLTVKLGCDLRKVKAACPVTNDPFQIINDPEISIVVETIGGEQPALKFVLEALRAGKHVVTSNKELIAKRMRELQMAAELNGRMILFEGAVGGGIPILNTLRDELSGNNFSEIYGIVNGTTNYILSKMTAEGRELAEVLKEAQKLGYAEADPSADVEGFDASYKAAILAAVGFNSTIKWEEVYREGIEKISAEDIQYADEIGYVIKLLAIAKNSGGKLELRVHPTLVAKGHPLASVSDNFNAIYLKGEPVGELMLSGRGAGGDPTSSAVINDVIALASQRPLALNLKLKLPVRPIAETESRYYIRLQAPDKYGVLAGISKAFADKKVSIAAVTQKETIGNQATIIILLHKVAEKNLRAALAELDQLAVVKKVCNIIRII